MKLEDKKWWAKLLGSFAREAVRVSFTAVSIWLFIQYGSKAAADCNSNFFGIKLSSVEILSIVLIFTSGIGLALLMKVADWWSKRGK